MAAAVPQLKHHLLTEIACSTSPICFFLVLTILLKFGTDLHV